MTVNMLNATEQFKQAIRNEGMDPPEIELGRIQRFPGKDKPSNNTAGWCIQFPDGQGGVFGDHSRSLTKHWQAERERPYTAKEQEEFRRKLALAKKQSEEELRAKYADAATRAQNIWDKASPANDDHPYLVKKGITANGARLQGDLLVIPIWGDNEIQSLQLIHPNGDKRFLARGKIKDCYSLIDSRVDAKGLCIAEGFATGATIHHATGFPVALALNAENLVSVANTMREQFPDLPLIVCADDDYKTKGNPGLSKATIAARAVKGKLAIPDFGNNRPIGATDFNDLAAHCGLDAVCDCIQKAEVLQMSQVSQSQEWSKPHPLTAKMEPSPYPLDALPDTIQEAVNEVQDFCKAPVSMVTSSALSAVSLVIQPYVDVKRAEKLVGPVSLFMITIADSGERKSTCDGFFSSAIKEYQTEMAEAAKPEIAAYRADHDRWEARRNGIKEKIRQLAKNGKPDEKERKQLHENEAEKPEPPRVPMLLRGDETQENLAWGLSKEYPSCGIMSSEAGSILGSHGMGKDSVMRYLAFLNVLWDGGALSIGRRTSESYTVSGVRLTVSLQIQEEPLKHFLDRSSGLARGTGFLARFLITWPESNQGSRPFTDPPDNWPALASFNKRMRYPEFRGHFRLVHYSLGR